MIAENLVVHSEEMANAAWGKNTHVTVVDSTGDVTDPNGGNTASKLVYAGGDGAATFRMFQNIGTLQLNDRATVGMWARCSVGTANVKVTMNASGSFVSYVLTPAWQLILQSTLSVGTFLFQCALYDDSGVDTAYTLYLWHPQATRANRLGTYVRTITAQAVGGIRSTP